MKSGIYRITCTVNGKVYVGSAQNIKARWTWHQKDLNANTHHNRKLQHAWNKYGHNAFEWTVLEHVCVEKLIEREQHYIDSMGAADKDRGFNLAPKAGSCLGFKHSDETKELWSKQRKGKSTNLKHTDEWRVMMAERMRGRKASPETLARMTEAGARPKNVERLKLLAEKRRGTKQSPELIEKRIASSRGKPKPPEHPCHLGTFRGKKHSAETRAKLAEAAKKENLSPETRAKMAESCRGRVVADATKEKLRKVMTGRQFTDESLAKMKASAQERARRERAEGTRLGKISDKHRATLAEASRNRVWTEESRQKCSEANRGRVHTPESRANMAAAHKGQKPSPETRARMSEAHKGRKCSPEVVAKRVATLREANRRRKAEAARLKAEQHAEAIFLRTGIKPAPLENPKSETQGKLFD